MDKCSNSGEKEDGLELDEEGEEIKLPRPKSEIVDDVETKQNKRAHFNDDDEQAGASHHKEEISNSDDDDKMDKLSNNGEKKCDLELDEKGEGIMSPRPKSDMIDAVETIPNTGVRFNDDMKQVVVNRLQGEASNRYDDDKMDKLSNSGEKDGGLELDEEAEGIKSPKPKSEVTDSVESKPNKGVYFNDDTEEVGGSGVQGERSSRYEEKKSNETRTNVPVSTKSSRKVIYIPSDLVIQTDCLTIGEKIGSGGFSDVFAATYEWRGGTDLVALKSIKLENAVCSKMDVKNLEREIMVLRSFRVHENVVTILGACSDVEVKDEEGNKVNIHLGIMMEISYAGSLFDYLQDKNSMISRNFCFYTSFDIANGLLALHSHGDASIFHRDIKSMNVLLFHNNSRKGFTAKISDFGLARMKQLSTLKETKTAGVGTPNWLPPESYDGIYKEQSDVWEFGMVMYEIASRSIPFDGCQSYEIMKKVLLNRDFPDLSKVNSYFPEELLVIMKSCWIYEANDRPDFDTIVGILTDKLKEKGLVFGENMKKITSLGNTVEDRFQYVKALNLIEEQLRRQVCQDRISYDNIWMGLKLDTNSSLLLECVSRLASSHSETPSQPNRLRTLNDIIVDAQTCVDTYHQIIQPLVESARGTYVSGTVKDRDRCTSKVENDYGGDARRLVDVIRGAGVFTSCTNMYKMIQAVEKSSAISIVRCKDRLNKPLDSGYRDVILNISLPYGTDSEPQVAELQLRFKPIHEFYLQSHRMNEIQPMIPIVQANQSNMGDDIYAQSHRMNEIQQMIPDEQANHRNVGGEFNAQSHRMNEIQHIIPAVQANQSNVGAGRNFCKWKKRKHLTIFMLICIISAIATGLITGLQTNKEIKSSSAPSVSIHPAPYAPSHPTSYPTYLHQKITAHPSLSPSMFPSSHENSAISFLPSYQPSVGTLPPIGIPTFVSWTRVRHVPPGNYWHPATDNLAGTEVYGNPKDNSLAWSIKFEDALPYYTEFLFSLGDGSLWLITTVDAAIGSKYVDEDREIVRSSISKEAYVAKWHNQESRPSDPWLSVTDNIHGLYVYKENSYPASFRLPSSGADVYIQ